MQQVQPDRIGRLNALVASLERIVGQEEILRSMVAVFPGFAMVTTPSGGIVAASARACALLGYSAEEMQAMGWHPLVHPDDLGGVAAEVSEMVSEGRACTEYTSRMCGRNGRTVVLQWAATPFLEVNTDAVIAPQTSGGMNLAIADVIEILQPAIGR